MENLVHSIGVQIIGSIGLLYSIGLISHFISSLFYIGVDRNLLIINGIGFFGIPFHELAHVFLAVIFNHQILRIQLFEHHSEGISGQVLTNYDRNNFYQKIGLFFIGVGPILIGILIIFIIMRLFMPGIYHEILNTDIVDLQHAINFNYIIEHFRAIYFQFNRSVGEILAGFIIISITVTLPMSKEDLMVSFKGLPYLLLILILLNTIVFFINPDIVYLISEYILKWSEAFLIVYLNLMLLLIPLLVLIIIIYRFIMCIKK